MLGRSRSPRIGRIKRRSGARGHLSSSGAYIQQPAGAHLIFPGELKMSCRRLLFLIALPLLAIPVCAQTSSQYTSASSPAVSSSSRSSFGGDRHFQDTPVGSLYQSSAFAHGYRHGYERGFHVGDTDVHMGRAARVIPKLKEYQPAMQEYSVIFGSRQLFQEGYQAGFSSGYNDAISGLEFRASERISNAASGLNAVLSPSRRSYFDEGFANGFRSSHSDGAPVERVTADYVEQYCRNVRSGSHPLEYCSGFSRGYMLGIADAPAKTVKIVGTGNSRH